ncbi:MAG: hypothetical protein OXN17_11935 [Candidatus Poribacteria bacterium]|nr:hypothetical protein [Candidatus Poribacteria bacterium]MDE0506656.1 hypothetical protein [Candidatus Poribacteria bacterium]
MSHRKQHDGRFKATAARDPINNQQTIGQIASEFGVNPSSAWIASAGSFAALFSSAPRPSTLLALLNGASDFCDKISKIAHHVNS